MPPGASGTAQRTARLIFDDESNGTKLDRSQWFWCYPDGSPHARTASMGFHIANASNTVQRSSVVSNGTLSLVAVRHSVEPHFAWTSGMVTTGGSLFRQALEDDSLQGIYVGPNLARAYHVYAIDWEPTALTWYVDGIARFSVTAQQIEGRGAKYLRSPMYLLANLAVGGWVSPPNKHTPSPASMKIDYVRVWDRRP